MMKRHILFSFCLFFSLNILRGQTWTRTFGNSADSTYTFNQVIRATDGGLLMVGSVYRGTDSHLYLVKTDKNGVSEWQRVYKNIKTWERIKCVASDNVGYSIMGSSDNNGDTSRIFFLKIDTKGNQTALKLMGNTTVRNWFSHGLVAKDNNLIVYTDEREVVGLPVSRSIRIYKLTPQGDTIWTKRYPNLSTGDAYGLMRSFVQTSDNGFLISADSVLGAFQSAPKLLKISENGQFEWLKTTPQGQLYKTFLINNNRFAGGSGFASAFFDEQGTLIWNNPAIGFFFLDAGGFVDGTFLVTQNKDMVNVTTSTNRNVFKIAIAKFNLAGQLLWANSLPIADQTQQPDIRDGIGNAMDTCFIVAGGLVPLTNPQGMKAWVAQIGNCGATKTVDLSVSTWKLHVAQNPVLTETAVTIENAPLSISGQFQLYDVSGRLVMQNEFVGNRFVLEKKHLNAGLYFIKIKTTDGKIGTQKIVML